MDMGRLHGPCGLRRLLVEWLGRGWVSFFKMLRSGLTGREHKMSTKINADVLRQTQLKKTVKVNVRTIVCVLCVSVK